MDFIAPGMVFLALVLTAAYTLYYLIKSRHLENMARIEHGFDERKKLPSNALLNLGVFMSFLGTGLLFAYTLARLFNLPVEVLIPGFLLIFGGVGLVLAYLIGKKQDA